MSQGLIDRTTLEAATEGIQVIGKVFLRALLREAAENGWYVDVTNDTQTFMRPDRDALGMIFGPGGSTAHDVAFTRLGSESYGFMNPGLTYHTDLRVRNMESTLIPHANAVAWGAETDGIANARGEILQALNALKAAGGGELFLPPGIYRLGTGISISNLKGITIRGAGMTSTVLQIDDVGARHFTFTSSSDVVFRDLSFDRPYTGLPIAGSGGISMPKGSQTFNEGHRFENVHFQGLSASAIEMDSPRGLVINNVFVDDMNGADAIDLLTPFSTTIASLVMTDCEQRGLYLHGYGRDVTVLSSRAVNCGIGFEASQCVAVFHACTAEEGVYTSDSYPGYGFVAGDTYSQVTLMNTSVVSTAGITAYVETTGAVFAKFNALQLMAGVTTTENTMPGTSTVEAPFFIGEDIRITESSPGEIGFRNVADTGYVGLNVGTFAAWYGASCVQWQAVTDEPLTPLEIRAKSLSTPVADFGVRLLFKVDDEDQDEQAAGYMDCVWTDPTAADYTADFVWGLIIGGGYNLTQEMRLSTAAGIGKGMLLLGSAGETPTKIGFHAYNADDGAGNWER